MTETVIKKSHKGLKLIGLGGFLFLFPLLSKSFGGISHYLDVMVFAGIHSLLAIGLCMLMGYAGQISLGHASFFGLGAYVSGVLTVRFGMNPWPCIGLGVAASAAVAFVIGAPALKLRGHYLAMATLAFCVIVTILFNQNAAITGGPDGLAFIPGIEIFGWPLDTIIKYYYFVWSLVLIILFLCLNLIESRVGRALRSIHDSSLAAGAVGVHVAKYKINVFVLSAMLASVGGSLYAHYLNFINPSSFDLFVSIKLIIMIMLGGMFSLWGAVTGAVLITFLGYEWLHYFEEAEVMIYGAIILVVVIFLPKGIVSLPQKIANIMAKRSGF